MNYEQDFEEKLELPFFDDKFEFSLNTYKPVVSKEAKNWINKNQKKFNGYNSENFVYKSGSLRSIIQLYRKGYAIVPGLFNHMKKDPITKEVANSRRVRRSFVRSGFCCYDADEWENYGKEPRNYEEMIEWFPDIENDFCYVGESSSGNPNYRFILRFPLIYSPQYYGQNNHRINFLMFNYLAEYMTSKYPFIAQGSAKDITRISYGNAIEGTIHRVFCNIFSFSLWKSFLEREQEEVEYYRKFKRLKTSKFDIDEKKYYMDDSKQNRAYDKNHPWSQVIERVNGIETLKEMGYIVGDCGNDQYLWKGSSDDVHSVAIHEGRVLVPWSNHATEDCEKLMKLRNGWNIHRFIFFELYGLDVANKDDKDELYTKLAQEGFGIYEPRRKYGNLE